MYRAFVAALFSAASRFRSSFLTNAGRCSIDAATASGDHSAGSDGRRRAAAVAGEGEEDARTTGVWLEDVGMGTRSGVVRVLVLAVS